jgi:hypothetical protein
VQSGLLLQPEAMMNLGLFLKETAMQKQSNDGAKTNEDKKADNRRIKDREKDGNKTSKQPTSYDGGDAT